MSATRTEAEAALHLLGNVVQILAARDAVQIQRLPDGQQWDSLTEKIEGRGVATANAYRLLRVEVARHFDLLEAEARDLARPTDYREDV